jgi:hypothetical protein
MSGQVLREVAEKLILNCGYFSLRRFIHGLASAAIPGENGPTLETPTPPLSDWRSITIVICSAFVLEARDPVSGLVIFKARRNM